MFITLFAIARTTYGALQLVEIMDCMDLTQLIRIHCWPVSDELMHLINLRKILCISMTYCMQSHQKYVNATKCNMK